VEKDKPLDPTNIGLFCSIRIIALSQEITQEISNDTGNFELLGAAENWTLFAS